MTRGHKIILDNGREFPTKGAAEDFFRNLLSSTNLKITKNDLNYSDLLSLYKRSPEFIDKSGVVENIDYFYIKNSGQYSTPCFHVANHDGSHADWSFRKAITQKKDSKFDSFSDGARHNLEKEIQDFRDGNFRDKCKDFLAKKGFSEENFPDTWVTKPEKLQYRASLVEPIKSDFIKWYLNNRNQ